MSLQQKSSIDLKLIFNCYSLNEKCAPQAILFKQLVPLFQKDVEPGGCGISLVEVFTRADLEDFNLPLILV